MDANDKTIDAKSTGSERYSSIDVSYIVRPRLQHKPNNTSNEQELIQTCYDKVFVSADGML